MPGLAHRHHHHHHGPGAADALGDRRLTIAVGANLLLTVAQVVGGIVAGSLALFADALHNLNDAATLGVALLARRIARRPADRRRTFGYRRAEVVGALITTTALIVIGLDLGAEAITRFFEPVPVRGLLVIAVAGIALLVDLATAALTYAMSRQSLNIRAAFLHNVADALGSVGVIVAGLLILRFGWTIADPIATLVIAGYVLYQGVTTIGPSIRILMEGTPEGLDLDDLALAMRSVPGVLDVHHLHAWQLDERHRAAEAHVVLSPDDLASIARIKRDLKALLADRFDIAHATLEFEAEGEHGDDHPSDLVPGH